MRVRLTRGRWVVTTRDGRQTQYAWAVALVPLLPLAAAVVAFIAFAGRRDADSLREDLRVAATNLVLAEPARAESALETVEVLVPENIWVDMERALESGNPELDHEDGGDRPFINALFMDGGTPLACEMALIGPRWLHRSEKPSVRIKLTKLDAREGLRRIDLYSPRDPLALDEYLYATLADHVGLLHTRSEPVRFFVNRKFMGVYLRALPPGPPMERVARRLPGVFALSQQPSWQRSDVWRHHGRVAEDRVNLQPLFEAIAAEPSEDARDKLERLVDLESFARFAAIRAVLGRERSADVQDCVFQSPRHGRIQAVAWPFDGVRGEHPGGSEAPGHPLLARLSELPDWVSRRDEWIAELLERPPVPWLDWLDSTQADLRPDLSGDLRLVRRDHDEQRWTPVAVTELERLGSERRRWLESRLDALGDHLAAVQSAGEPSVAPDRVLGPGEVVLEEDLVTASDQRLVVRAGTRLRLAAGVGVYARGPVEIEGTADDPVVVRGLDWRPWGAFALLGEDTAGSNIAHLDIEGGGGSTFQGQQFRAVFHVHDCSDVQIFGARFGPSGAEGDSVALTRSSVAFESCVFEDARRDALDAVLSDGILGSCRFIVADRNAIDLRASRFRFEKMHIDGAYRSAISVGEQSRALLVDSVLQRCDMAIDSHDGGRILVRATRLQANRIAVSCERRSWRYDRGGEVALDDTRVIGSRGYDVTARARSRVLLRGSGELRIEAGAKRVREVASFPEEWEADWAEGVD